MRLENLRIQVVDANSPTRRQVALMLRQLGVSRLSEADGTTSLLAGLKNETPDLLFISLGSESGDGIALTRRVRAELGRRLPIIVISGFGDLWRLGEAKRAGADGFLVRPFTSRALANRIRGLVGDGAIAGRKVVGRLPH